MLRPTIQRDLIPRAHVLKHLLRLMPLGLVHDEIPIRRRDGQGPLNGLEFFREDKGRVRCVADVDEARFEESAHVFGAEAVAYCADAVDAHFGAHRVDNGGDDRVDARGGVAGEPGLEVDIFYRRYP